MLSGWAASIRSRFGKTGYMSRRYWLPVSLTLLISGWGSNQFASMMSFYRDTYGFTQLSVTSMLGIYVLGLLPALFLGGAVSDRMGRKRATQIAVLITSLGSLVMIVGAWAASMIFLGRLLAGVATGVAMAAATSWVKELSQSPWDPSASDGAGARRASLMIAVGFFLGPVASGIIANFLPAPESLPYLVHIALCLLVFIALIKTPETRPTRLKERTSRLSPDTTSRWSYVGAQKRFFRIVGFGAPWAFISGTVSFAVIPEMLTSVPGGLLMYTTVSIALTLGFGVVIQPLAAYIDRANTARASIVGMSLTLTGLTVGVLTITLQLPWLGFLSNCLLGSGYGVMMSAGLLETQRISSATHIGAVTAKFYTLAYAGYLAPTVIAFLALSFDELAILTGLVTLSVISMVVIMTNSHRHIAPRESAQSKAFAPSTQY